MFIVAFQMIKQTVLFFSAFFQWREQNPNKSVIGAYLLFYFLGPGIDIFLNYGIDYGLPFPEDVDGVQCISRIEYGHALDDIHQHHDDHCRFSIAVARIAAMAIFDSISVGLASLSCAWMTAEMIIALHEEKHWKFALQMVCSLLSILFSIGFWHGLSFYLLGCVPDIESFWSKGQRFVDSISGIHHWVMNSFNLLILVLTTLSLAIFTGNYIRRRTRAIPTIRPVF